MTDTTKTYEVGFGRPPRHTRFKAGQSGNPKGKAKGAVNLATDVEDDSQSVSASEKVTRI